MVTSPVFILFSVLINILAQNNEITSITNPKSPQDSSENNWGSPISGLQMSAMTQDTIEVGMQLEAKVELRLLPGLVPPEFSVLHPCYDMCTFFHLQLVNNDSGECFDMLADHREFGPPPRFSKGELAIPLDGTPIPTRTMTFTLSRMRPELIPGTYQASIYYEQPEATLPLWGASEDEWRALHAWHGKVHSRVFALEVLPETPRTETFVLPKELRLRTDFRTPSSRLGETQPIPYVVTTYTEEDSEEVTLPIRNGHYVGSITTDGHFTTLTGPYSPGFAVEQWHRYKGGDRSASYKLTLVESCSADFHFLESCGYKVLWERTFDLTFTANELESLLK